MVQQLEIIRCTNCGKETYSALARCPHCGKEFRAAKPPVEKKLIPFAEFKNKFQSGKITVSYSIDKIYSSDFYDFAPTFYVWEIVSRFVIFPAYVVAFFTFLTWLERPFESYFPDYLPHKDKIVIIIVIAIVFGIIAVFKSLRKRVVKKKIAQSAQHYLIALDYGFISLPE